VGTRASRLNRDQFLERLRTVAAEGVPILGAGAGTGLVAKAASRGGADFIAVYCTSKARHRGLPTSIIGDPNTITLELLEEVAAVVEDVPIVAGIHATDPTRDPGRLLAQYAELGASGVINYPSVGLYGREYIGGPVMYDEGLEIEAQVLDLARDAGLATFTYTYRPGEASLFASHVDVIVAHAGWTVGGLVGAPRAASYEDAAAVVNEQIAAGKNAAEGVLYLGHGGPFATPSDTTPLYELTDAIGFVGASSIERIPIEQAVMNVVGDFKAVTIPNGREA
jgi:predicted TIM-barrel enzyme